MAHEAGRTSPPGESMMNLRIVRKEGFTFLHHVQIKKLWWWRDIYTGDIEECKKFFENYKEHKQKGTIVIQQENLR